MAKTVIQAFDEFLKNKVNLDSDECKTARSSRDWLIEQISKFKEKDNDFPTLYNDINIEFGSFARGTKIRELDDIDIMIGISAQKSTYETETDKIIITVESDDANDLLKLCFDNSNKLNSTKVTNKFVSMFSQIPQYSKAEIKKNHEAATLNLSSYNWTFDVVPCFMTKPEINGKTYYLIPDGDGYWKKTDPRIDEERTTTINKQNEGNVLQVIRIIKFWNKRPTMPSMPSYLLETMILNYYQNICNASKYVDIEIVKVLLYIYNNIMNDVSDQKGIQGNINNLSQEERQKIKNRAETDYYKALDARNMENSKNYDGSINKWGEIFGSEFPKYE